MQPSRTLGNMDMANEVGSLRLVAKLAVLSDFGKIARVPVRELLRPEAKEPELTILSSLYLQKVPAPQNEKKLCGDKYV